MKREACWGQAGPIHAGSSKPTPASLNPSHESSAGPRPHHQSLTWSPHPRASWGVQVLCCMLPGFSALACPGLLTRASTPRQQPTREHGRGRLGLWSPSQAPDLLARPPPTDCGPRMPPPIPDPLQSWAQLGSSQASRPCQEGLWGLKDGAPAWKEDSGTDKLCKPAEPHLHHLRPPHPSLLPVRLEKGTEIKPGFLTLTWVVGEGWGCKHQSTTTQIASLGSKSPHRSYPPQRFVNPHVKYPWKWPHLQG